MVSQKKTAGIQAVSFDDDDDYETGDRIQVSMSIGDFAGVLFSLCKRLILFMINAHSVYT